MSRTYTHTFKNGTTKDYTYEDIFNQADNLYEVRSGSLDAVTRAGLEYIAQGGDKDAQHAQAALSYWNNPEAVKNAYYDYNKKNGIEETPPTTTPPTSVPTTSGGNTGGATTGGDTGGGNTSGKPGKSVKGKYETNLAAIDEQERYAIELANQQRDEAVKRAYALNDQSQVTYGQNAERLAQMGLTNAGYGDYLTGVAYGNLVGGIERANVNADNAIRDAYYAAGQAKSQVYDTMHNELAAAEKAYKDTLASIVTAVASGEINEEQAKAIAEAYGIKEDEALTLIGDAATAYKDTSNEGSIAVDPTTTNTDIDNTPDLTEEQKTAAKAERDKSVYEEETSKLQAEVTSGEARGTLTDLDEKYANGGVGKETYQHIYFDRALAFVENATTADEIDEELRYINSLVSTGKLSEQDAESLREYAESRRVVQISENAPITFGTETRAGHNGQITLYTLTFDTEKATFKGTGIGTKEKEAINRVVPSPKEGEIVKYDGNVYVYYDSSWKRASSLNEIFDKYAGLYNKATKPKHTPIKE